ncbi:hypothetical protein V1527DRAFT_499027 [Lipomyces starkeyi]
MAIGDNAQVSYQRALKFLTANEPEMRLDIRLSVNLHQAIIFAVYNVLVQHQKQAVFECISAVGESTYSSVNKQGRRSTKTPDAGPIYYYDEGRALTIIEEVGVSEWYPQLNADIMLWMNEFHRRTYSWFGTLDQAIVEFIASKIKPLLTNALVVQIGRIVVQGCSLHIGLTVGD